MSQDKPGTTRDDQIWEARQAGLTYVQISRRFAISASRARHICNRREIASGTVKPARESMLGDRNPQGGFRD